MGYDWDHAAHARKSSADGIGEASDADLGDEHHVRGDTFFDDIAEDVDNPDDDGEEPDDDEDGTCGSHAGDCNSGVFLTPTWPLSRTSVDGPPVEGIVDEVVDNNEEMLMRVHRDWQNDADREALDRMRGTVHRTAEKEGEKEHACVESLMMMLLCGSSTDVAQGKERQKRGAVELSDDEMDVAERIRRRREDFAKLNAADRRYEGTRKGGLLR